MDLIWATGDIHGDAKRFSTYAFPEQKEMTKDDVVLQLGDFGLIWDWRGNDSEEYWLNWLEDKNFTLCFCDGNHENFDRLYKYPVKEWNGGKVHEIRPHILHLMRGEVFDVQDKKIFVMGGASSHDIQDGILDPAEYKGDYEFYKAYKKKEDRGEYMYRIKGRSWWDQELPTEEEMQNGLNNLEKCGNKVDFMITHSPSASGIALLGNGFYKQDKLTKYLEKIKQENDIGVHIAAHMHVNRKLNEKDFVLYEQIIRLL